MLPCGRPLLFPPSSIPHVIESSAVNTGHIDPLTFTQGRHLVMNAEEDTVSIHLSPSSKIAHHSQMTDRLCKQDPRRQSDMTRWIAND